MTILDRIYAGGKDLQDVRKFCEACELDPEQIGKRLLRACRYPTKYLSHREINIIGVLGAKFVAMDAGTAKNPPRVVTLWKSHPKMYGDIWISDAPLDKLEEDLIGKLNFYLFPSIAPGECIGLSQIEDSSRKD